ncbi:uncharacterized protein [Ptychodera flava]|uniref:uncharacterized protein n=1 Tax=Ptychodera flava TaxID=63121 RepID=UPI003969FA9E
MEHIKAPEMLDFHTKNLAVVWKRWKEELSLYVDLTMAGKEESQKCKLFLYLIGREGREIHETMKFDSEEKDRKLEDLVKAFDNYCNPKKNETVERYKFFSRSQEANENLDKYVTDLKILAATCNFGSLQESLIKDRLVCGINDSRLRERLLREADLDLEKCLQICRAAELSKESIKTIEVPTEVHAVKQKWANAQETSRKPEQGRACKYCGKRHGKDKEKCPAYGKQCHNCKKANHFASQCMQRKQRKVHSIHDSSQEDYEEIQSVTLSPEEVQVNRVTESPFLKQIYATMLIDKQPVKFQLDLGATCNIIPVTKLGNLHDYKLTESSRLLTMYNKTTLKPRGQTKVKMVNPKNGKKYIAEFVVVEDDANTPLLGSRAIQQMGFVKVQHDQILLVQPSQPLVKNDSTKPITAEQLVKEYPDVFEGTGLLEGSTI